MDKKFTIGKIKVQLKSVTLKEYKELWKLIKPFMDGDAISVVSLLEACLESDAIEQALAIITEPVNKSDKVDYSLIDEETLFLIINEFAALKKNKMKNLINFSVNSPDGNKAQNEN